MPYVRDMDTLELIDQPFPTITCPVRNCERTLVFDRTRWRRGQSLIMWEMICPNHGIFRKVMLKGLKVMRRNSNTTYYISELEALSMPHKEDN